MDSEKEHGIESFQPENAQRPNEGVNRFCGVFMLTLEVSAIPLLMVTAIVLTHLSTSTPSRIATATVFPSLVFPVCTIVFGNLNIRTTKQSTECVTMLDIRHSMTSYFGWDDLKCLPADEIERCMVSTAILGTGSLGLVDEVSCSAKNITTFVRKRVLLKPGRSASLLKIVKAEARVMEDLVHTHVVHIFGTYENKSKARLSSFSLLMFPVGEGDLSGFLHGLEELRVDSKELVMKKRWLRKWFTCLSSALAYIHDQGVRHQDIKPSNIVYLRDHIFFTDFSSAARFEPGATTSTENPTRASAMYSAPEILDLDIASDHYQRHGTQSEIFSLGCVFVEMLAVLNGYSVSSLHAFLRTPTQNGFSYARVIGKVGSLFEKRYTEASPKEIQPKNNYNIWKEALAPMLQHNRKRRPSAHQVYTTLLDSALAAYPCTCIPTHLPGFKEMQYLPERKRSRRLNFSYRPLSPNGLHKIDTLMMVILPVYAFVCLVMAITIHQEDSLCLG